ncbi:acetoacetate--CoA ligase [Kiloniella sp. b19]|uniref:acetoacetate--CoA ligase n=1 Tax=Kiloniella sp. GXU_MW_B19 TaxID=3141326 RepID=UPI0031E33A74
MTDLQQSQAPLWSPSAERIENANVTDFMKRVSESHGMPSGFSSFSDLHSWSVEQPEDFWSALWDWSGLVGEKGAAPFLKQDADPRKSIWFPEARINFAENLLKHEGSQEALVFWGEEGRKAALSRDELRAEVARVARGLKDLGVEPGDRVAAVVPNMPQAIIGMLATVSLGAVWSSASPDFGVQGLMDRFGQISPKVLISVDAYDYNNKRHSVTEKAEALAAQIDSLAAVVMIPWEGAGALRSHSIEKASAWEALGGGSQDHELEFVRSGYDQPLFIMFSSGTTGVPKCIVHRAGGVLLKHVSEHLLHGDLKEDDSLFFFTTCGWMMWNWLVSGLVAGARVICFDGSPFAGTPDILWRLADEEGVTHFGTSPKYLDTLNKMGLRPADDFRLEALRTLYSTGSPLLPEAYDFIYAAIKQDLQIASISGGTDIVGCFLLGEPTAPVWKGQLQTPALGCDVCALDGDGNRVAQGEKGELVCRSAFPSMPLMFWGDEDGARYHKAYFARFDNIWTHGDFLEQTAQGGFVIHGRSDATLNPGGVRIGTAEIYRQVEILPQIREAIVVGQDWDGDVRVVLFVVLQDDCPELDEALVKTIRTQIRTGCTPRHVPAKVLAVQDIPRTRSGKITELAVRDVVNGRTVENVEALANPEALEFFRNLPELQSD